MGLSKNQMAVVKLALVDGRSVSGKLRGRMPQIDKTITHMVHRRLILIVGGCIYVTHLGLREYKTMLETIEIMGWGQHRP